MWYHHDDEFKLNYWNFAQNIGIKVSYTWFKNLHISLKTQKNEENTIHVFYQVNYISSHIEFYHIRWVATKKNAF